MSGAVSPSGLNRPGDSGPDMDGFRNEADLALDCCASWGVEPSVGEIGDSSSFASSGSGFDSSAAAAGASSSVVAAAGFSSAAASDSAVVGDFSAVSPFFADAPAFPFPPFFFFNSWAWAAACEGQGET